MRVTGRGSARAEALDQTRHALRLDDDLSPFYAAVAADPELSWVTPARAGFPQRNGLRGRRQDDLHHELRLVGDGADGRRDRRRARRGGPRRTAGRAARPRIPDARAMAAAGEDFYRDVARAGYRGAYLRTLADDVAAGRLDLERLGTAPREELSDDEVEQELLALPGVGPYAARTSCSCSAATPG